MGHMDFWGGKRPALGHKICSCVSPMPMTVPTLQFLGLEQPIIDEAKANALLLKEKFDKNGELNKKFQSE